MHRNSLNNLFFMHALRRNKKLDIDYITNENRVDVSSLHRNYDVVLLPYIPPDVILALSGIENSSIPVIARVGDPHSFKTYDALTARRKLKIDYYFNRYAPSSFYKYYPKYCKYETIIYGLEPSLYSDLRPYDKRLHDKIVISGEMDKPDFIHRTYYKYIKRVHPERVPWLHYKLRTICNSLPYTIHTRTIQPGQSTKELPAVLSRYRAAIAATTTFPTAKYIETPAAGCLTFMEITEKNDGQYLGYEDGKTAIFINESNYKCKFEEYLEDPFEPKWERIARAGQKYTLEHLTNDNAADRLASLMCKIIGE